MTQDPPKIHPLQNTVIGDDNRKPGGRMAGPDGVAASCLLVLAAFDHIYDVTGHFHGQLKVQMARKSTLSKLLTPSKANIALLCIVAMVSALTSHHSHASP